MRLAVLVFILILINSLGGCDEPTDSSGQQQTDTATSGISSIPSDSFATENLVMLGRVWGFLKYYHPNVTYGKYNWDYELFQVLPRVASATSVQGRNDILSNWIDSLGNFDQSDSIPIVDSSVVKLWPDYSWINQNSIGQRLYDQLEKIRYGRRTKNHYVIVPGGNMNPIFTNEEDYAEMKFPDAGFRMLALFRYWNCIEYFFPDKHLIGTDWVNVLRNYIPMFAECKSELEYETAVNFLFSEVHDSHAVSQGKFDRYDSTLGYYYMMVSLAHAENKLIVTSAPDGSNYGIMYGDVLLAKDGMSIDSLFARYEGHIQASNTATEWRDFCWFVRRSKDSIVEFTLERDGDTTVSAIRCFKNKDWKNIKITTVFNQDSSIYDLTNEITCVYPANVTNEMLSKRWSEIENKRGLIIDLRCYPYTSIMELLCEKIYPHLTPFARTTSGSVDMPGLFTYTSFQSLGKENPLYYKGKVVVLVNEETQSHAEYMTMSLQAGPNVTVIGSTTAGADGNVSEITLPGGLKTWMSGIGIYYPDGRETQRVGIIPDIEVHPTIQGIREGRDELMEKAIEIIEAN